MDIESKYGNRLQELLTNYEKVDNLKFQEIIQRGFNVPKALHSGRLLFIGLNPSFTKQPNEKNNKVNYYNQPADDSEMHKIYYNPLRTLAEEVRMQWVHWDVYYAQETKHGSVTEFNNYLKPQLELSIEIIKAAKPSLIVVNNAYASRLVYENALRGDKLNEDIGTYEFPLGDGSKVPIFFSSMLSGQRALDTHSKERLAWHMKQVLKLCPNKL